MGKPWADRHNERRNASTRDFRRPKDVLHARERVGVVSLKLLRYLVGLLQGQPLARVPRPGTGPGTTTSANRQRWGGIPGPSKRTRKARPGILSAPGRILWYVSKGDFEGTMSIRACSRINEVAVDKPKTLFRRFRRLGVYEWNEVFETADRDLNRNIMAIRFDDTELLKPVPWKTIQDVLRAHGKANNVQSPLRISPAAFNDLYAAAVHPPATRAVDSRGMEAR